MAPRTTRVFRAHVREALEEFGRRELTIENWGPFARGLSFAAASTDEADALLAAAAQAERELGAEVRRLVYLSVPPTAFAPMEPRAHRLRPIDIPEHLTIEGRAGFYEETGAFRDMVVAHLFHVLGFVAMESPSRLDAQSLRRENDKLFEAIKPLDPARVGYGQYDGYHSEPGCTSPGSTTPRRSIAATSTAARTTMGGSARSAPVR